MAKQFGKDVLKLCTDMQLLDHAATWDIKQQMFSKDALVDQIYHHHRNQIKKSYSTHPQCHPSDEFSCSLASCSHHPCKSGKFHAVARKKPTNFGRSLPIKCI